MAFEGAVPDWYTKYVWSSCNILPEMANPFVGFNKKKTDAVARQLQVFLEKPLLEKVILHTQNICDALKEQCERNVWKNKDEYLKRLMSDIYQYLWKDGAKHDLLNRLRQKPIVYLPSENKFVTCGVLVIHLEEGQEIKPYLYSAPLEFGGNFELFEKLGTEKRPTCATYARVLERITQDVRDQELHPNERQSVLKAIHGLFLHLKCTTDDTDVCLQVPILYLPTEDYKLMDSTKMIYSNNNLFYEAIGKDAGLPYFVGFQSLKLFYFERDIEKLPVKYRPH
ncbi:sacsin-like, partial [Mizuhopecten yessoensis]|uniref:sacsin-like n=1 Tax=Mizuhopecten yessoensis TaxID=6573 RepID=UPI000B45A3A7